MNGRITKRLRKTFLEKPVEMLTIIRTEYGKKTEGVENSEIIWKYFKKLYKQGKIPKNLIVK